MNTANLLNINVDKKTSPIGKSSGSDIEVNKKQSHSDGLGIDSESVKESSEFGKALKESMGSNQESQNSDAERQQAANDESSQNLPEDGKQLPKENDSTTTQVMNRVTGVDDENVVESIGPSQGGRVEQHHTNVVSEIDSNIDGHAISNSGNSVAVNGQIKSADVADSNEGSRVELDDMATSQVNPTNQGASLVTENNSLDQDVAATSPIIDHQESIEEQNVSMAQLNIAEQQNGIENRDASKEELKIDSIDFIEQAQNATTAVGVNSSALKDVFQNISGDENQLRFKAANESASVFQSSEMKNDSLFSGSVQDQNGKQASLNFQNNLSQFTNSTQANWTANMTTPASNGIENQNLLIDVDTNTLTDKLDSSKVSKTVSEAVKPNPINEPLGRTAEFTVKTPVLNRGFNEEVNNHISYVAKNGGGNAKIKLNPAHLGPVEASIKIAGEGVTVQINANNNLTRDALDQGVNRLKEMLQEQGFTQVDVNVSDQGLSKGNRESTTAAANASNHSTEGDLEGVDEEIHESSSAQSTINGVVDYYA